MPRYLTQLMTAAACALAIVPAAAQQATRALPERELRLLAATFQLLKDEYVDKISGEELVLAAVRGMLKTVDSEGGDYYDEEQMQELRGPIDAAAIGLELAKKGNELTVVAPIPGSPAHRVGLRPGDVVTRIDAQRTADLSLREAVKLLRGPDASQVSIEVTRAGSALKFDVERTRVRWPGAAMDRPVPDIVVLRVPAFRENSLRDSAKLLKDAWSQHPPRGMVLDLRGNPGGLLDAAVGLSSVFLPAGVPVAQSSGRLPESNFVWKTGAEYYSRGFDPLAGVPEAIKTIPLVVLVDEGTAAGAEMVAAALQDHRRAQVLGRRTFGRASIQTVRPIDKGAVKFTTARWVTPHGKSVHGVGVQPDKPMSEGELQLALELLSGH